MLQYQKHAQHAFDKSYGHVRRVYVNTADGSLEAYEEVAVCRILFEYNGDLVLQNSVRLENLGAVLYAVFL